MYDRIMAVTRPSTGSRAAWINGYVPWIGPRNILCPSVPARLQNTETGWQHNFAFSIGDSIGTISTPTSDLRGVYRNQRYTRFDEIPTA
jgi:hypothetical protein